MIHGDTKGELLVWERLLAGSLAGATAQTIIYPMEVREKWMFSTNGELGGCKCTCRWEILTRACIKIVL